MEFNWGSASAKVDAGLASLVLMQTQWQMENGDVMGGIGFPESRSKGKGSGGFVTPRDQTRPQKAGQTI